MQNILTLNQISKSYGNVKALQNVSFSIPRGTVYGILGPNGSGKTTLLSIVLDVLKANEGSYNWFSNNNASEMRKQIGSLLETPNFYHYLSAEKNLAITQSISGRGDKMDIEKVLKQVNLYERRASKFSTFSLGMKQRLAIAAALLGSPEVLVLDEPTNGLDPVGIAEIRELIKNLAKQGTTVIMASHLLDEVEKVCNYVAVLKKGVLLVDGKVDEVMSAEFIVEVAVDSDKMETLCNLLKTFPNINKIEKKDNKIELSFDTQPSSLSQLNKFCFDAGFTLSLLNTKYKSLEAKFFELTNKV
jgi:ABC-2 type transport system ATP-binding protein